MAAQSAASLPGAMASALVDMESGKCLAHVGEEKVFNLSLASTLNAQFLRSETLLVREQFPGECLQCLVITLGTQYHLMQLVGTPEGMPPLFLYLVLSRKTGNLMLSRLKMEEIAAQVSREYLPERTPPEKKAAPSLSADAYGKALGVDENSNDLGEDEELPPFLREKTVMQILALAEASCRATLREPTYNTTG